ncbi:hypothetical protein F0L68_15885 [Solihabitans fulvus]|uniref:ABC-type branched-chain amino acid transport system, substrate-binding protein n=1 Tax=Solihabitans fulvus TaxID=1892852 RepID=A0A5B2XEE7_9PSEU|nr:hypothetical protein [Solihabitans fulvus]KAA2261723.1 hypothetical protein F0L68_15885 [Solihabitans fulvus]
MPPTLAPGAEGQVEARQDLDSIKPLTVDPPPVWTRRWVSLLAVLVVLGAAVLGGARWRQQHCGLTPFAVDAATLQAMGDECIGVSAYGFSFQANDARLSAVEDTVAGLNRRAEDLHRASPSRPYFSLVFVAALSSLAQPPDELFTERESLEGLAVAQSRQLDKNGPGDPIVRLLLANAGDRVLHGPDVAGILKQMTADDPSIIGVVGLEQTREPTVRTIEALNDVGLPMLATTLSADGLTQHSPMYFQLSPQDRREGEVAAAYAARRLAVASEPIARKVRILYSADRQDTYSNNLREDLQSSFAAKGVDFEVDTRAYVPAYSLAAQAPGTGPYQVGKDTCGYDGLVFFAGRPDDFATMLDGVNDSCNSRPPRILGDDDISRFVADLGLRGRHPAIPFDYLSFALGSPFCIRQTDLWHTMGILFPQACRGDSKDSSTDGYVALSYDAVRTYVTAVEHLRESGGRLPLTPGAVWHELKGIHETPLDGESGVIDFGGVVNQQVPTDKFIAVQRVEDGGEPKDQGSCGRFAGRTSSPWCP